VTEAETLESKVEIEESMVEIAESRVEIARSMVEIVESVVGKVECMFEIVEHKSQQVHFEGVTNLGGMECLSQLHFDAEHLGEN